jgi:hypothetical protein
MNQEPNATVTADGTPYQCHATLKRRPDTVVDTTAGKGRERQRGIAQGWEGNFVMDRHDADAVIFANKRTLNDRDFEVDDSDNRGVLWVSGDGEPPTV